MILKFMILGVLFPLIPAMAFIALVIYDIIKNNTY